MLNTFVTRTTINAPLFAAQRKFPFGQSLWQPNRRHLNLHEYQSKELMRKCGINAQRGWTVSSPSEARLAAQEMIRQNIKNIVMKAQVFAGGRGKGTMSSGLKGGVQFATEPSQVEGLAEKMLGHYLVTHQTGPEGLIVNKLLLHEGLNIAREFYLAIILDRKYGGPVIVSSRMGGVDIEEVSEKHPEAITVVPIDILKGPQEGDIQKVVSALLPEMEVSLAQSCVSSLNYRQKEATFNAMKQQLSDLINKMYNMFIQCDASQVEINPLAVTDKNDIVCVDAKLGFDDNAVYRQKELFAQEDTSVRDSRELEAEKYHLNFVSMDGNIGCLVNGAGLAMATMDLITLNGGKPANFLDVGGGATKEQVAQSFGILKSDPNVKAIFVNIFGGITRCDNIANGIVDAAKEIGLTHPLIVRLVGNSADKAKEILSSDDLKKYKLNIIGEDDFAKAAKIACDIAKKK